MGRPYTHITMEERCEMARLRAEGYSVRQIAANLDRSPSSIARELKRNASNTQGYQPGYADHQARAYTPRKCLGYLTPAEVFSNHLLHFKCESTSPLSRE